MKTKAAALMTGICAVIFAALAGCGNKPTVTGPETAGLSGQFHGIILRSEESAEIKATELPSGTSYLVKPEAQGEIAALSGPDDIGRIVYLDSLTAHTQLHLINIGAPQDTVVFTDTRISANGDAVYGSSLALSPKRGRAAVLSHLSSVQMPDADLIAGQIEIWDVNRKTMSPITTKAIDEGFAWMPDGKRLIFVDLNPAPTKQDYQDFGAKHRDWASIPTAYFLDAATGIKTKLGAGWRPVVSTNGQTVILHDGDFHPRQLMLPGTALQPLAIPGLIAQGCVLGLDGVSVIYPGMRTQGAPAKSAYSHGGIRELETIKVARFNTGNFQTILPYADALQPMSFGHDTPQNRQLLAQLPVATQ